MWRAYDRRPSQARNVPRSGTALPPIAMALLLIGAGSTSAQAQSFPEPPPFPHPPGQPTPAAPRPTLAPSAASPALTRYEPQAQAQTKPMRVEVIDGRSFRDIESGAVYRLWGIDVCRPEQSALLGRQPWPCGTMARAWLVNATLGKWVSCNVLATAEGASAVRCSSSTYPDLALAMVREGQAVALPQDREPRQIRAYLSAEETARKAFRGLWGSAFDMPWAYRTATSPDAPSAEAQPINPTETPSPHGVEGDQPIQKEGADPKNPNLVRTEK